jgi:hypothetical protein
VLDRGQQLSEREPGLEAGLAALVLAEERGAHAVAVLPDRAVAALDAEMRAAERLRPPRMRFRTVSAPSPLAARMAPARKFARRGVNVQHFTSGRNAQCATGSVPSAFGHMTQSWQVARRSSWIGTPSSQRA